MNRFAILIFGVGLLMISGTPRLETCCGVTGTGDIVKFKGQKNIIVWDPAAKTEHFIRKAAFATDAAALGFIAPTPSVPELEEVSEKAFQTLANLKAVSDFDPSIKGEAASVEATVEIVQVKDVAGYHAITVKANDIAALSKWMDENGFVTTPSIREWTAYYVNKGWYLTTFKVIAKNGSAGTGTVRMSFKIDKPFNPFYVPDDNKTDGEPGGLALFFVSPDDWQPEGELGPQLLKRHWRAELTQSAATVLAEQLKLPSLPAACLVTSYDCLFFPEADIKEDVFFVYAGMGAPTVTRWIQICVAVIAISGFVILGYLKVRRIRT